jgi:hypothetical protein
MTGTTYYSNGRRIPVTRLRSARVARTGKDREPVEVSGWSTLPLGVKGYQLVWACVRCPQVITTTWHPSEELQQIAAPEPPDGGPVRPSR